MSLKLYVWEGTLTNYTDGIMFALADNLEQAKQLIIDSANYEFEKQDFKIELDISPHKVYTNPKGFHLHGGD